MTHLVANPASRVIVSSPMATAAIVGGLRAKSTAARSAWANKGPIVTYDEVKPLTRQPTDVSFIEPR